MVAPSRRLLANAIRALSMDAVQKANSGHPGAPMGMADIAEVLWNDYLKHNPSNPNWSNRDRFVLSNGHGSMLLYSLLHLSGYDLQISDLQAFRQLHSKTPGHPEWGITAGVETTTGPLGQGIANAVGMALAERTLAQTFNKDGFPIVDNMTYVFVGDGCLMEGVSHEACSLAGTLGLGKLVAMWDQNGISIDGPIQTWFGEDTAKRFEAYGWHVIRDVDGHNSVEIKKALDEARANTTQPTLICCKTIIGFGAPNLQGKEKCHGSPLGDSEIALAREALAWHYPPFVVPEEIKSAWDATARGQAQNQQWQTLFDNYAKQHPKLAQEYLRRLSKQLPEQFAAHCQELLKSASADKKVATRKASHLVLESIGELLPELLGGSADLTESNLTAWGGSKVIDNKRTEGNYIHYGVREFGMAAMMNGIALYGAFIPYGGTFLTFLDYMRNAVRLAALMNQRSIYVFTHDSIGLGEDGPTHQPIEHITMLRATPKLQTWRPCDFQETVIAWRQAIVRENGPTALVLTRQAVDPQPKTDAMLSQIEKGAYVLLDSIRTPDVILIATGSEVSICMKAAQEAQQQGIHVRVVSMPCREVFLQQEKDYQEQVLPARVQRRIAVEAGATLCWHQFVGSEGKIMGIDTYGESAPAEQLYQHFGLTPKHILEEIKALKTGE